MTKRLLPSILASILTLSLCSFAISATPILNIAVASNFTSTLKKLSADFSKKTGVNCNISSASTGTLFLQIENGASYDLYLAADSMHPQQLIKDRDAVPNSLTTYAAGELVLASLQNKVGPKTIEQKTININITIANPNIAPYGLAAKQYLQSQLKWQQLHAQLVIAENIGQAYAYVKTGNIDYGLIAKSESLQGHLPNVWPIPQKYYRPIKQQAVILTSSKQQALATRFLQYLTSDKAKSIIRHSGYQA